MDNPFPTAQSGSVVVERYFAGYDLRYDSGSNAITVHTRLQWAFDKDVTKAERKALQADFDNAVGLYWNTQLYRLEATLDPDHAIHASRNCFFSNPDYTTLDRPPARTLQLYFTTSHGSAGEHWDVHVRRSVTRESVVTYTWSLIDGDVNLAPTTGVLIMAHEYGHTLGLPDEYSEKDVCRATTPPKEWRTCKELPQNDARFFKDSTALMNSGDQLRARYFVFLRNWINRITDYAYMYQVRPLRNEWDRMLPDATVPQCVEPMDMGSLPF